MNKILLIILALIVIGGGVWLATKGSGPSEPVETKTQQESAVPDNTSEETASENLSGMGSLANLMGLGGSVQCNFKSTVENQISEGMFYTDGERFLVDATMRSTEGTFSSNVINDGSYTYTWGTTPQGTMAIKTANNEAEADISSEQYNTPQEDEYVDINEQVEYDCDRWSVNSSVFVPPSDIEFMDMEAMMNEAMQNMPEGFEMPEGFGTQ